MFLTLHLARKRKIRITKEIVFFVFFIFLDNLGVFWVGN
jgi:hypothetical protein